MCKPVELGQQPAIAISVIGSIDFSHNSVNRMDGRQIR